MADSSNIRKSSLPFPEAGDPVYLQTMRALRLFRRVPIKQYSPRRVEGLLADATTKAKSFYSHGLYALETVTRPNT